MSSGQPDHAHQEMAVALAGLANPKNKAMIARGKGHAVVHQHHRAHGS